MTIQSFKKVYYTESGPKRPFAKNAYGKTTAEVLREWETNPDPFHEVEQFGFTFGRLSFIDDELFGMEHNREGLDISFSDDHRLCLVRLKHVPEGKVREVFELEILESVGEEVLSPEDEAFIVKLKEYRRRGGKSLLTIPEADIMAIRTIDDHFKIFHPECKYVENLWKVSFGPLEQYLDRKVLAYSSFNKTPDEFELLMRSALYQSGSVDEALELANSVFKNCDCGRGLTDEELRRFKVDVDEYHKNWPSCYIGEKGGFYFVTYGFNCQASAVTDDPEAFGRMISEAGYTAWALSAYSGGGQYGCGGVPIK